MAGVKEARLIRTSFKISEVQDKIQLYGGELMLNMNEFGQWDRKEAILFFNTKDGKIAEFAVGMDTLRNWKKEMSMVLKTARLIDSGVGAEKESISHSIYGIK